MPRSPDPSRPLEVWAGVECTVNRVRDEYVDQIELTGHAGRLDDLDRFAALGVSALRYPVLWERTAPDGVARADWRWADERLGRLRELGIRPIVGLVHHGSGPRSTSLVDPAFPERLAEFARAVVERYPWVDDWTPVNEPLTTARFSALYGHWYPHVRDEAAFVRALLVQCRATVLAMEAIRAVNPAARLVVTEDIGKTYSTPELAYQAELENERRFASFDLLTGAIDEDALFWRWAFRDAGLVRDELDWFRARQARPDVLGVNHYLTSERWLDERVELYPPAARGGNGRHRYADVEALRVPGDGYADVEARLLEVWDRYRVPIAITEAHNGSTREEQLRWLDDVWRGARAARARGADVRAVTVWALLGAVGWDRLVTRRGGKYEPGPFDVRSADPRPTALAAMARGLARDGAYEHPVLDGVGWWKRPERVLYGAQP
ncbi:MAG: family 1 glycosylhydrolase, partial [Actinomycetota bacterium]|nr:family 1 glycosylhydrolase [Actinomycetota bacterium]